MQSITLYIGLDVHKDSITIAIAQPGPKGEIRLFGTITNDLGRLEVALGRIRKAHPGAHLEAGSNASEPLIGQDEPAVRARQRQIFSLWGIWLFFGRLA